MPASPSPAFVRLNYHSAYGLHTMQVPTLAYSAGSFATWNAGTVLADTMINALVTLLLPFYPITVIFDNYIVFSQPTPGDDPVPVLSASLTGADGTSETPGWTKAVQMTMTIRSSNFGVSKIVFLDAASNNDFSPTTVGTGAIGAIVDELSDEDLGWSAQDNGRPQTFIKLAKTLNEKLRKAYRMG